jgi:hypothetical protein
MPNQIIGINEYLIPDGWKLPTITLFFKALKCERGFAFCCKQNNIHT